MFREYYEIGLMLLGGSCGFGLVSMILISLLQKGLQKKMNQEYGKKG